MTKKTELIERLIGDLNAAHATMVAEVVERFDATLSAAPEQNGGTGMTRSLYATDPARVAAMLDRLGQRTTISTFPLPTSLYLRLRPLIKDPAVPFTDVEHAAFCVVIEAGIAALTAALAAPEATTPNQEEVPA